MPSFDSSSSVEALSPDTRQHAWLSLEFRAVLLLILMALIVLGAGLYLMWARGAFDKTQSLTLVAEDSDGVSVGMDLSFSGFPIGRVRSIELADEGAVLIHVDVPVKDARWLRSSSIFTLEKGLVGSARLKAFTGIWDDEAMPAGAERNLLRGDVTEEIPLMLADARKVMKNLNHLLDADSALSGSMAEVQHFARRLNQSESLLSILSGKPEDAEKIGQILQQTQTVMEAAAGLLTHLDAATGQAQKQLLGDAGLSAQVQASLRQLETLLQETRSSMTQVQGTLTRVDGIAANVQGATTDLDVLRAEVESSLLRLDAMMNQLQRKWPFAPEQAGVQLP